MSGRSRRCWRGWQLPQAQAVGQCFRRSPRLAPEDWFKLPRCGFSKPAIGRVVGAGSEGDDRRESGG
eukprot:3039264-Rhodomonas_salina.2